MPFRPTGACWVYCLYVHFLSTLTPLCTNTSTSPFRSPHLHSLDHYCNGNSIWGYLLFPTDILDTSSYNSHSLPVKFPWHRQSSSEVWRSQIPNDVMSHYSSVFTMRNDPSHLRRLVMTLEDFMGWFRSHETPNFLMTFSTHHRGIQCNVNLQSLGIQPSVSSSLFYCPLKFRRICPLR